MTEQLSNNYDVFEDDLLLDEGGGYHTIGRWGLTLLHLIKGAFVVYSAAHNIQASLTATGDNTFAIVAQIIGIIVLEVTISALYMAGVAGKITGQLQGVLAASTWLIGLTLAAAGIVADSRLHAGHELGTLLTWHLNTGLFIAPVIMVIGTVLVVFTDPILLQQIGNSRSRAIIERERVKSAVMAEKAAHQSRKIIHNIRLGAQRQMAIEAKKYYKSPEVQAALKQTAVDALQDVMRQSGIAIPEPIPSSMASSPPPPEAEPDFLAGTAVQAGTGKQTGEETAVQAGMRKEMGVETAVVTPATHPTTSNNGRN